MNSYNQVASDEMMRLFAVALNEYVHDAENNTNRNSFIQYSIQNINLWESLKD